MDSEKIKFLCDQMLAKFGKWLRAAGYDTSIIETPMADRLILKQAISEQRLLITRDKEFLHFKESAQTVIWLKGSSVEECANELSQKISINWLYKPQTRCLLCNTPLIEAPLSVRELIPKDIQEMQKSALFCPKCAKVYWEGSHSIKILHQLQLWQINNTQK